MAEKKNLFRPEPVASMTLGKAYLHGLSLVLFYAGISLGSAMLWQAANHLATKFFKKEE